VHDITSLEVEGLPSVMVASTEFREAVAMQARALGFEPAVVYVPHPIQDRTDDELRAMADAASAPVLWFGRDIEGDGATVRDARVVSVEGGEAVPVVDVAEIPLFGAHNVDNVLAATALARAAGVSVDGITTAVRGFRAVPHRLCLLYTSPSPRDLSTSRMPSSA